LKGRGREEGGTIKSWGLHAFPYNLHYPFPVRRRRNWIQTNQEKRNVVNPPILLTYHLFFCRREERNGGILRKVLLEEGGTKKRKGKKAYAQH